MSLCDGSGDGTLPIDNQDSPPPRRPLLWLGLAALTLAVFLQSVRFDFVNFDDPGYVSENRHVLGGLNGDNVRWAFTTTHTGNWSPLTWLSLMLDAQVWGRGPGGFHFTNVLLHLANVLLLFAALRRMTGAEWPSAIAAALFAVHPLHVESVAWISGRKDVLSTLGGFFALWTYARFVQRGRKGWYFAALGGFLGSLLAKQMLVTLPFLLLLLDAWPLRRWTRAAARRLLLEKLPFFGLTVAFSAIAFYAQQAGKNVHSLQAYPLDVRLANAVLAYGLYLGKTVWPTRLAVFYPHPGDAISATSASAFSAVLLLLTAVALLQARTRPYLAVGWFWFLGTLVPVIGLVQIGNQQMADRYTYVPIVGLFIAVVWLAEPLLSAPRRATWPRGVAVAAVMACAAAGWMQTRHWTDSVALFQQALAATGDANFVAHYNLGNAWKDRGRPREAAGHYRKAAQLRPGDSRPHNNLGVVLERLGRPDAAIAAYRNAIHIDPDNAAAHNNLGVALHRRGEIVPAIRHYRETLRIDPRDARAHNNLAMALEAGGRLDEAEHEYRTAVRLAPDNPQFHNNLGVFLIVRRGRRDLAIDQFRAALRLDPNFRDAAENLKHAR